MVGSTELPEESHIVMYDVQCDGLEDTLTSCNFRSDNSDSDSLSCNNAYVICQGTYNNNYYNNNNNYNGGKLIISLCLLFIIAFFNV